MNLQRALSIIVAVLLVAALGWLHYDLLAEAYGSGPPHYGQTTNMDKWSSPWPGLLAVDAIGALVLFALLRWGIFPKSRR